MVEKRSACIFLVGMSEEALNRWDGSTNIDLKVIEWTDKDQINLTQ